MGVISKTGTWGSRLEASPNGLRVRGPADPFVEAMQSTRDNYDRLALATRALRKDPDCIEANLLVASRCDDVDLSMAYLNVAVEAGERLWNSAEVDDVVAGDWLSVPGARPWMQAIKALGEAQESIGDVDAARETYGRLLAMDPIDFHGVQAGLDRIAVAGPTP